MFDVKGNFDTQSDSLNATGKFSNKTFLNTTGKNQTGNTTMKTGNTTMNIPSNETMLILMLLTKRIALTIWFTNKYLLNLSMVVKSLKSDRLSCTESNNYCK